MTPERWRQIEEVYHLAIQREASQRAAFLKQVCAGDEEMQREIESLLTHENPAEKFMEAPGISVLAHAMAQDHAGSMIGRQLGAYRVLSLLGAGGMGEVYQARDTRLGRLVALKILPPSVATDPERKRRFLQEAKAVSTLNHPNIVTLHDMGSEGGINFLVMEYVEGKTLDKIIPGGGLDLKRALLYSVEIADAFAKAHAAGIVHRDLKPGNVMVSEDGAVKVLDFGIAKLTQAPEAGELGASVSTAATTGGMILGTASYMSPEQAEGKKIDTRSDIFSFGALLYEMVTGRKAFQGDSKISTIAAILGQEPKPPSQFVKRLPPDLERIIARCLRKDPERRLQTMADLKVALQDVQDVKEGLDSAAVGPAPPKRRHSRRLVLVTALFVAVAGGVLWFVRPITRAPEAPLTAVPFSTLSGSQSHPNFSPDGNQVAFAWNGEKRNNSDIYVKLIGTSGPPLRLTTDPADDSGPEWSPDGRFIAFLRALPSHQNAVMLIPALGGPERKIAEGSYWGAPAWSPDGNWLAITEADSARGPLALSLLSVETGEKRRLTFPPGNFIYDSAPAFSPDGRCLAFIRVNDSGSSDLYLLTLSDGWKPAGPPRQLTFGNRGSKDPAWTPDGREIVYAVGTQIPRGLWRIAVFGPAGQRAEPKQLVSLGDSAIEPSISRNGRRLAYVHPLLHHNIWRMAASSREGSGGSRGTKSRESSNQATPFMSSTRDDGSPNYSPDGKRIVFQSNRSGNEEVWMCDADGANAVQVTSFGDPDVTTPRWSPDGAHIAFDSSAEGQYDIYVVGASGGKPKRMTTHPANDGNPSWSHDGQWIYFDSARTGEQQVWKMPANGGEAIQVTRDGGIGPVESPDGKFLYFNNELVNGDLWRIPVGGGEAIKVLKSATGFIGLALVDKGIYFRQHGEDVIRFLKFDTNTISTVATIAKPLGLGLTVSPDGQWILYTQVEQAGSELMLVENFR